MKGFKFSWSFIYYMDPELTEDEFEERLEDIAKDAIREECVDSNGFVKYKEYVAHEYKLFTNTDILDNYPLSVEEYCDGKFGPDSHDLLTGSQTDAIQQIRRELFISELDQKIKELINGGWDAIKTEKEEYTVTEEKTVLDE